MLIAGMLSTFPALVINSLISPIIITFLGISMDGVESLGYGMILFLSAPIGEELSKALAILFLSRFIDSGKRGFQIGFSVGLGFALLENMSYILGAIFSGEGAAVSFIFTTVLRAIGSIPGHATWTAISGYAIGHHIAKNNHSKSLIDGIHEKRKVIKQETQWALFDKKTGQLISSSSVKVKPILPKWLSAGKEKEIPLTKSPSKAIFIAILCHSIWNGTLWISGKLLIDSPAFIQITVNLTLIITLIAILWIILRRLIPYAIDDGNSILS
jgi:RsiW-degrading membrane proteinase PrsW (M82 family)